jgi:hypothetical protein
MTRLSSSPTTKYSWQKSYSIVIMEAGPAVVRQRIGIAQEALNARMLDLTASREDSEELLEIAKAMRKLADLKKRHKLR